MLNQQVTEAPQRSNLTNIFKAIQFIFNETAKNIASDELARALKLLNIIELIVLLQMGKFNYILYQIIYLMNY